jgi:hypothetical protein
METKTLIDIVICVANILLVSSLFPSIFSNEKPHPNTSLLNIVVSIMFIYAYYMLGLWMTIGINFLIGVAWFVLYMQSIKMDKFPKYKKPFDLEMIDDNMDLLDDID